MLTMFYSGITWIELMGYGTCEAVISFAKKLALLIKEQSYKPKSAFHGMSVCLEGVLL